MSLGVFAGEFLKAFSGARANKQVQEKDEKQNKLILQLMEEQLKDATGKREAMDLIARRVGGQGDPIPQFAEVPGELGLAKTGETPAAIQGPGMSLSALLANQEDPKISAALMRSGMLPQIQQGAQAQSQAALAGLVEESGMPIDQAFRQPAVAAAGLRAGLTPPQMFQQTSVAEEPTMIRELRAVGIDPMSEEGRRLVVGRLEGSDDMLREQMQAVNLQIQALALEDARRKRESEAQDAARGRRQLEKDIRGTLTKGQELAALNTRLSETALATGQPLVEVYRAAMAGGAPVLESMGFDTGNARQIVSDFDRFNKLATDFGIDMMERMVGTGTITDTKFEALQKAMAGIGTSPGANNLVIADVLQTGLDGADIEGIEVEDRETIEAVIKTLKSGMPDLRTMSDEQLRALASGP